jgi:hypothetical protein
VNYPKESIQHRIKTLYWRTLVILQTVTTLLLL